MFSLNGTILPRCIWSEIEQAGEMRSGTTDETDCDVIGPNPPGPSGSSLRPAQGVGRLDRSRATIYAALLLDRVAVRNKIGSIWAEHALGH